MGRHTMLVIAEENKESKATQVLRALEVLRARQVLRVLRVLPVKMERA